MTHDMLIFLISPFKLLFIADIPTYFPTYMDEPTYEPTKIDDIETPFPTYSTPDPTYDPT